MTPPVSSAQLNNQQTQILAYIDFVIGIVSVAVLTFLIAQMTLMTQEIKKEHHVYIAICALFVLCIGVEIVLAVLMLRSSKKNQSYPFRKSILITVKVFLFLVFFCGVIILFCYINIIPATIGTFLLKYKLYSFWVLWSVPDNYTRAPNSDRLYIISNQIV